MTIMIGTFAGGKAFGLKRATCHVNLSVFKNTGGDGIPVCVSRKVDIDVQMRWCWYSINFGIL